MSHTHAVYNPLYSLWICDCQPFILCTYQLATVWQCWHSNLLYSISFKSSVITVEQQCICGHELLKYGIIIYKLYIIIPYISNSWPHYYALLFYSNHGDLRFPSLDLSPNFRYRFNFCNSWYSIAITTVAIRSYIKNSLQTCSHV